MIKNLKRIFPQHKAHPQQAGFVRRGLAFLVDALIIGILSSIVYSGYAEIRAWVNQKPSPTAKMAEEVKEGGKLTVDFNKGTYVEKKQEETELKKACLRILKDKLPAVEYEKAEALSEEEILKRYWTDLRTDLPEILKETTSKEISQPLTKREEDQAYKVIKEYIISLLYFVLFFRLKAQTPGKKLFRLKVIDLEGKPQLGWYQCFERAHGYVCSGLFLSLGFLQVLWHKSGLTMHDKIADTTVIKLPPRAKKRKTPKVEKRTEN
ncbi:MAG: RDD family protein [Candidatus Aminicenantes bacterium]|nr:RDD family protein [Candidatus Aminicenantes bacterium]